MKAYTIFLLLAFNACENNTSLTSVNQSHIRIDSAQTEAKDSAKSISFTYERLLEKLSDTLEVKTPQNFYNRNYALTIQEFIEDKQKAKQLLKIDSSFTPSEHKAYQIILSLDNKQVIKKPVSKYTFRDSLRTIDLERYYLDQVTYTGVRTKTLYFRTFIRLKDKRADKPFYDNEDIKIEFKMDYLEDIGKFTYEVFFKEK